MEQVERVDRDAAAPHIKDGRMSYNERRAFRQEVVAGKHDEHPLVRAFARHRIEATRAKDEAIAELVEALGWAFNTLTEINPSNYDHDDVCEMNAASVEVMLGLKPILAKHGPTP